MDDDDVVTLLNGHDSDHSKRGREILPREHSEERQLPRLTT